MEYLFEIGVFAGKAALIVVAVGIIIGLIVSAAMRTKQDSHLEVENLNKKYKSFSRTLKSYVLEKKDFKSLNKKEKKDKKKDGKKKPVAQPTVFVIQFHGDIKASTVEYLADEITAVLSVARKSDEVVICLESSGGMVHAYGLAAAQLLRIRDQGIKLTVCIDKVAASGGYMMACTADHIVAAPFAILGSIGVLAQVPNFSKVLKKHDVDYQEITAGEYKRTLSIFGEVTESGKKKFTEQIEDTHDLFKGFVSQYRPKLDIEKVATGEYWFGLRAKELKLLDAVGTSDDYLFALKDQAQIFKVKMAHKKKVAEKLSDIFGKAAERGVQKALETVNNKIVF